MEPSPSSPSDLADYESDIDSIYGAPESNLNLGPQQGHFHPSTASVMEQLSRESRPGPLGRTLVIIRPPFITIPPSVANLPFTVVNDGNGNYRFVLDEPPDDGNNPDSDGMSGIDDGDPEDDDDSYITHISNYTIQLGLNLHSRPPSSSPIPMFWLEESG